MSAAATQETPTVEETPTVVPETPTVVPEAPVAYEGPVVRFVLEDSTQMEVPRPIAEMFGLVQVMLADDDDEGTPEVPILTVTRENMDKCVEFCRHHQNNPMNKIEKPLRSNEIKDAVSAWDAAFIELEVPRLIELIRAANYLECPSLLELSCAKFASLIKHKSIPEIKKLLNVDFEFTPEMEAQVRKDNNWTE